MTGRLYSFFRCSEERFSRLVMVMVVEEVASGDFYL